MANYVLNEEKMFSDIADGVAIVINSETGIYYGMNGFGTAIFAAILEGASTENIIISAKDLANRPENIEECIESFVKSLSGFDILIPDSENSVTVVLNADIATEDKFTPTVQEFNDAQELLLADPIHEVKEDTGWKPTKDSLETDEELVAQKHKKAEK